MIKVLIPTNPDFVLFKNELERMYIHAKDKIGDTNTFDFIINNTLYYAFIMDGVIIGAIYFFDEDEKLFLNAYAGRKHFAENIKCVKMSLKWFNCDIYAEAQNKASALCLLKSGFKRVRDKLFVYKH